MTYLPEVDLSQHIVNDEALAVQRQLMQGQIRLQLGVVDQQLNINSQDNMINTTAKYMTCRSIKSCRQDNKIQHHYKVKDK